VAHLSRVNNAEDINFDIKEIDEDYLPLFEIKMVKGRNFSKDLVSDIGQSVLVNESFVKKAGWENPLGQVVDFYQDNKKYTVVGIFKDYHFFRLQVKLARSFLL
jgi:putative ABC transport system permease protein